MLHTWLVVCGDDLATAPCRGHLGTRSHSTRFQTPEELLVLGLGTISARPCAVVCPPLQFCRCPGPFRASLTIRFWICRRCGGQSNYGTGIRNTDFRPTARWNQYTLPPEDSEVSYKGRACAANRYRGLYLVLHQASTHQMFGIVGSGNGCGSRADADGRNEFASRGAEKSVCQDARGSKLRTAVACR